jgi:hypothetical protein
MLDSRLDELKEKNLDARQKMKADIRLKRDAMRQQKIDAKADTKFHLILHQPLTGLSLHNATNPKDSPEPPKAPYPLLNRQQSDDILVKNLLRQKGPNNLNENIQFLEALEQKIIISEQPENFSYENEKILYAKIEISEVVDGQCDVTVQDGEVSEVSREEVIDH